jgi:polysaccharide deacetylase family protein (PEP-CTERM system associated)
MGAPAGAGIVNALSVDVEEYYHALVFQEATAGLGGGAWESRVEPSTERVLALLGRHGIRGTFFVLGEVAAAHPALVRRIAGAGHEVACHGYRHARVDAATPPAFRADVRRAKAVLEDLAGAAVLGYRAPNFSIGRGQPWAFDVLLEEGFEYDSSTYPIAHDRYGDRTAPRAVHEVRRTPRGRLIEFPIGTVRLLGWNLPAGGGGYFRVLPGTLVQAGIRRVNRCERRPTMFYFHPWELDPAQPRPPMRWRHRARHYAGTRRMERKLETLLAGLRFAPARDVLGLGRPVPARSAVA